MSDSEGSETEAGTTVQQVADPEEFNQQRRLRSIFDARDRARNIYEATQDPTIGESPQSLAANYRAAVQNYIGEIEGLLKKYEWDDDETDLWQQVRLGPILIQPPQEITSLHHDADVRVIDASEIEAEEQYLNGLRGYLGASFPVQKSFQVPVEERHKGQHTVTATVQVEMPVSVSYRAFRYANDFLTKVGFDIEIESQQHRSVVDDELIEEVEEWRKQNLQE